MSADISINQSEIDSLLGIESSKDSIITTSSVTPSRETPSKTPHAENMNFQPLSGGKTETTANEISLVKDIPLELSVELGRTKRSIADILDFGIGTVVELTRLAGEPVDLMANGKLIAKGEVVVIDENFAVRITDIINQKVKQES
jgi:flagellar motor switch protein FliN/FliY